MLKLLKIASILFITFTCGECLWRTFDQKLNSCRTIFCGVKDGIRRNQLQNCSVLLDHNNVTVTPCVAHCLTMNRENVKHAVYCKCRNSKCIPPQPTTLPPTPSSTGSSTSPPTSSTGGPSTASSPNPSSAGTSGSASTGVTTQNPQPTT